MQSERREPDANENPYSRARLNSENTKLRAEITRLTEALRAAEEREKGLRELGKPFVFAVAHCKAIGKRPHDLVLTSEFEALAAAINGAKP